MRTADLSISLGGSAIFFIALLLLAALAAFVFYRYTLPPLPPRLRTLLSLLRGFALALLLLVLFEPVLRFIDRHMQEPVVAALIDASQSMTIRDSGGDRAQRTSDALKQNKFTNLPGGIRTVYLPFSSKLHSALQSPSDSLSFTGEVTNLSEAFAGIKELQQRENIQSVVLLSDGNYTAGKNPLYEAEALGIPVFTVGVGDTNDQKDVLIDRVVTNALAYTEAQVPIDVVAKSSGFSGENVEVAVSEGGTILDRKVVTLQPGVREYPLSMRVTPKEEGTRKYIVTISSLAGELTARNNTRTVYIKVLKSKLHIVIMSGAPHADVSAVRQALTEDQHFTVHSLVQKSAGTYYEGTLTKPLLDSADCFVFIGFPSAATGSDAIQLLREKITSARKPLLFINGKSTDYAKLSLFQEIIPFTWTAPGLTEMFVGNSIPEGAKHHSLISLEGKISSEDWQSLPPIYKTQTSFRAKPESEVLTYAVLQNIVLTEPLVAVRNIARQKSFAVTGEGVWRWRLTTQTNARLGEFLPLLLTNAVRWLTAKEDDRRIRISPVKEIFTSTEPVEFTGQVYDEQLRPVDNADVTVRLERGPQKFELVLNSIGNGLYEGSIDGTGEGDYVYTGNAVAGGRALGTDKGKFSVGEVNVEFLDTKMNRQLLEQIAFRTGGTYHDLRDAGEVGKDISQNVKFAPKELVEATELELWNWRYTGGVILLLLALEWFLRKRSGMI